MSNPSCLVNTLKKKMCERWGNPLRASSFEPGRAGPVSEISPHSTPIFFAKIIRDHIIRDRLVAEISVVETEISVTGMNTSARLPGRKYF